MAAKAVAVVANPAVLSARIGLVCNRAKPCSPSTSMLFVLCFAMTHNVKDHASQQMTVMDVKAVCGSTMFATAD